MVLPEFKYHPDPLSTGSIRAESIRCDCCDQAREFEYASSFYTAHSPKPKICPWCVSTGEAARKFQGTFSDEYPLRRSGIAEDIIREVCERTPSFNSWQQEVWQHHCGDACEFHGDAEPTELAALKGEKLTALLHNIGMTELRWKSLVRGYSKGGNPAVYKFVCRQCRDAIYFPDFT